jgi:hypothetical protein
MGWKIGIQFLLRPGIFILVHEIFIMEGTWLLCNEFGGYSPCGVWPDHELWRPTTRGALPETPLSIFMPSYEGTWTKLSVPVFVSINYRCQSAIRKSIQQYCFMNFAERLRFKYPWPHLRVSQQHLGRKIVALLSDICINSKGRSIQPQASVAIVHTITSGSRQFINSQSRQLLTMLENM